MTDETPRDETVETGEDCPSSSEAKKAHVADSSPKEVSERRISVSGLVATWIGVGLAILGLLCTAIYTYINFRFQEIEELRAQLAATRGGIVALTSIIDVKTMPDYPPDASDELKAGMRADRRIALLKMQCTMLNGEWKDGFCAPLGEAYEGLGLPLEDVEDASTDTTDAAEGQVTIP